MMVCISWKIFYWNLFLLALIFSGTVCYGTTDPRDVGAINSLHASLGSPVLGGWVPNGGDPCAENWQGVQCVNTNITAIILNDSNLGGELGDHLGDFSSIIELDLSNNHIGGVIPSNLPSTVRTFYLSSNQFTGSIPATLSSLGQVTDLSFGNNHLAGEIPDVFQQLPSLLNLNLSGNNLSGQLPLSMETLSYTTTLHLQNNQLTGILDVLQNLPLRDLNIENNLFSGPIPSKLLSIPNFRKDGNPFNTTVLPSPPVSSPLPSLTNSTNSTSSGIPPAHQVLEPSPPTLQKTGEKEKSHSSIKVTWIVITGVLLLILLGLVLCFLIYRCSKRIRPTSKIGRTYETRSSDDPKKKPKSSESLPKLYSSRETGYKEPSLKPLILHPKGRNRSTSTLDPKDKDGNFYTTSSFTKSNDDHEIDMSVFVEEILPPPLPPFLTSTVNPLLLPLSATSLSTNIPSSLSKFTIASLQQYTDSFSQDNLIREGMLGSVYRAETPKGRMLAVKKLNKEACKSNGEFLELVCSLSKLQHLNISELVGYCAEHGQQLLIYEYCGNGTLYEALHFDDEIHKTLSWNVRTRLALGAARALEYMHEICEPPLVHQNFKSGNILLDDELVVRVSDCGLASLLSPETLNQLLSSGYGAPELELGSYTSQSDVYSFGVVMLEILTGRKPYDRSRPRTEQYLVRWAIPQLHDIDLLAKMVDPSVKGIYPTKSLSRFADIISLCLQPEPEFRPPMSEIVEDLMHMI